MRIKYTPELLEKLVAESYTVADVIRKLGLREAGGNWSHINRMIVKYGINTSHFKKFTSFLKPGCNRKSAAQILVKKSTGKRENAFRLRRAMIEAGIEYKCVQCNLLGEWNGKPLVLEVNHKNNDWLDNRKENVEFLCPNCHSQQPNPMNKGKTRLIDRVM